MTDLWFLLFPMVVAVVIALFRFAGCSYEPSVAPPSYPGTVKEDNPVLYYRLQETGPLPHASADEMDRKDGTYGLSPSPLSDPVHLSPPVSSPSIELGVSPSIVPKEPGATAVRFNGSDMFALGPIGPLSKFSLEAIVRPEWNLINQRGFFFCVFESSSHIPGQGAPTPLKNAGFAVFAGPNDLANPAASPYTWQLWVGTGTGFQRAIPLEPGTVAAVKPENTYLAVTFGDTEAILHVFTAGDDLDFISHELARPAYLPAVHAQTEISLRIAIAGGSATLVPPFPGPTGLLYPLIGRMAEVALYETVLGPDRVRAHIQAAFNT